MPMPSEAEMHPDGPHDRTVELRLSDELLATVARHAEAAHLTGEEYIRGLIRQDASLQRFVDRRRPG